MLPLPDVRGMVRQAAGSGPSASSEDKNSQTYMLLTSNQPETPPQPPYMEVGVLTLVPVIIWCLLSWALSYAGSVELLVKFELFAFLPAVASGFACERIRQLRQLPAQLTCLKEENEWFKSSNAELKAGVETLRAENEEARTANSRLQNSIQGLESVRSAIETYASRHETDFGFVLTEFQKNVAEQQSILTRTKQIQRRTRRLAEAQWRALMLNLFAQVERYTSDSSKRGMGRKEYDMWLAMLPAEISEQLCEETFESIDSNGDDIIEVKEMCDWVQNAVKTLLRVDAGDSSSSGSSEDYEDRPPVQQQSSLGSFMTNPFAAGATITSREPAKPAAPAGTGRSRDSSSGFASPFAFSAPSGCPSGGAKTNMAAAGTQSRADSPGATGSGGGPAAEARWNSRHSEETNGSGSELWAPGGSQQKRSSIGSSVSGVSSINLAAGGSMKLFATHPPSMGTAAAPVVRNTSGQRFDGGSVCRTTSSQGFDAGNGTPLQKRGPASDRRELSMPPRTRPGGGRPSFNDSYMQKLFGPSTSASQRSPSMDVTNQLPPAARAKSNPILKTGGSPDSASSSRTMVGTGGMP